jgi:hypothetical protein
MSQAEVESMFSKSKHARFAVSCLTVALTLVLAVSAAAQTQSPTGSAAIAAAPEDVTTIEGLMTALYDVISGPAGQARDWDRFRSLFLPEGRLIPTGFREGSAKATATLLTADDYVARAGASLEENGFFESEISRIEERFENIAHVFSTYQSRRTADGEVFQRGINSLQLMWDGERWWIMNIMWRGVGPDVVIPARYLGGPR